MSKIIETAITVDGEEIEIEISHFSAVTGFTLEKEYQNWAANPVRNSAYISVVLRAAAVILKDEGGITGESRIQISTVDHINYYFRDWQELDRIFGAILNHNGISREPEKKNDIGAWPVVGATFAKSFCVELLKLMPVAAEIVKEKAGE